MDLRTTHGSPVTLSVDDRGDGRAGTAVLLHGLTATRDYVVMGSEVLEQAGFRVLSYDLRGHGRSSPAPRPGDYGYDLFELDLRSVLEASDVERALFVGVSVGAHTALRFALRSPERVAGLLVVTPGFDPLVADDPEHRVQWRPLAEALRSGGASEFARAYPMRAMTASRERALRSAIRRRMSAHRHPDAVADAMLALERSWPFDSIEALGALTAPTVVVGSRDELDPEHPLALAHRYVAAIPGAKLVCEQPGSTPLAWRGERLSRLALELGRPGG